MGMHQHRTNLSVCPLNVLSWFRQPTNHYSGLPPVQQTTHYHHVVELEQLKERIDAAGERSSLKTAGVVGKAAIGAAVTNLLELKKQYAELNNSIGVDDKAV
jgi:hypothetical protein